MKSFTSLLLSGQIADTIERLVPDNPLLRSGATAIAARWAVRSVPAALAIVAAGAAYRYLTKDNAAPKRKISARTARTGAAKSVRTKARAARSKPVAVSAAA
ncbi:hypothetical protein [Novosphingobium sp.]|uniref:hypothetical protein n=1 Tax=Novosphingobium sp. TaxID=1874826 RepID=UPI0025F884E5|nr:hypothetical protein [Novosphingobium sp.]